MSRGRFFEGFIIGSIFGVVATFLASQNTTQSESSQGENSEAASAPATQAVSEKTDVLISKTLEAIEQGFDKVSKMVDDRRNKKGETKTQ